VIEADAAFEAKLRRSFGETSDSDAVSEHVVHPMERRRFGRDGERSLDQTLVVAVARPEHDPVLAERNRLAVAVGRDVADGEDRHAATSGLAIRAK
jgi:hypothetical protein